MTLSFQQQQHRQRRRNTTATIPISYHQPELSARLAGIAIRLIHLKAILWTMIFVIVGMPWLSLVVRSAASSTMTATTTTFMSESSLQPELQEQQQQQQQPQQEREADWEDQEMKVREKLPPDVLVGGIDKQNFMNLVPALRETLCYEASPWAQNVTADARLWTTRLVYLAMYLYQPHNYYPFPVEFPLHRKNHYYGNHQQHGPLSSTSFYCPAKGRFLVASFSTKTKGLGANFRLTAVSALKAALATNRILVWRGGGGGTSNTMDDDSCRQQQDNENLACLFQPISSCILNDDEVAEAHMLTRAQSRLLFRHGRLPDLYQDATILQLGDTVLSRPQRNPPNLQQRLYDLSQRIWTNVVAPHRFSFSSSGMMRSIQRGRERLITPLNGDGMISSSNNNSSSNNGMFLGDVEISHGLMMYVLRPRPQYAQEIDRRVQQVLQANSILEEENQTQQWSSSAVGFPVQGSSSVVGLPIRGSDKCGTESECFSLEKYIAAASHLWNGSWSRTDNNSSSSNNTSLTLFVTSEDPLVMNKVRNYPKQNHEKDLATPGIRLIANKWDRAANAANNSENKYNKLEQSVLSGLTSLKLQMATGHVLANCCSNFHSLLGDLLQEQCGLWPPSSTSAKNDDDDQFQCLQDHPMESFRLCCAWDKSERCQANRNGLT